MSSRLVATVAALMVLLLAVGAAAEPVQDAGVPDAAVEPPLRILSPSTLMTEGGTTLSLPAGVYVLYAPTYDVLDDELRRLQDAETRLEAENASLRVSASGDAPGASWRAVSWVALALAAGFAAGHYVATHY